MYHVNLTNPESVRGCSTTELPWREGKKLERVKSRVNADRDVDCGLSPGCRGKIRLQVLFAAPQRSHEAHTAVFGHRTDPAFLMNITPSRKPQHRAGFCVPLCRKQK